MLKRLHRLENRRVNDRDRAPLVSVIVPMYNKEMYAEACIRSVLNQSFQNWELIIVDDGSTDRSLDICRRYAEKDKRICVLPIAHAGQPHTLNTGLARARGEWVAILDGDDMLAENALQILLANRDNVDVVMGLFETFPEKSMGEFREGGSFAALTDMGEAFTRFYRPYALISACMKIYRRSVVGDGYNEAEKDFSGWLFNLDVFPRCCGFRLVPETVWYYRTVEGSVSRRFRSRYLHTCRVIYERISEVFSACPEVRTFMARDYVRRAVGFLLSVCELSCITKPQKLAMIEVELEAPVYQQEAIRNAEPDENEDRIWKAFLAQDAEAVYQEAERLVKERDAACLSSGSQI